MDTSTTDAEPSNLQESPMNVGEEVSSDTKTGKRKRSVKKAAETEESSTANTRPRRTLPKRKLLLLIYFS